MTVYGSFETVELLHRGPESSMWSARKVGEEQIRYAVKVIQPLALIHGAEHAAKRRLAFLDAAELQKAIARGEAEHWAAIHEIGEHDGDAFCVTDLCALSLSRLEHRRLKADELHRIVSGIVTGLRQLSDARTRAHGNLKPGNVLVSASAIRNANILLTDPLPDSEVAEQHRETTDDLHDLGKLIHELVLHAPWRGRLGQPLPDAPEWKALGRHGQKWRELCQSLLDFAPPKLDEIETTVGELAAGGGPPKALVFGGGAVTAIVLIGVLVFMLTGREPQEDGSIVVIPADPEHIDPPSPSEPDRMAIKTVNWAWVLADVAKRSEVERMFEIEAETLSEEVDSSEVAIRKALANVSSFAEDFRGRNWTEPAQEIDRRVHDVRLLLDAVTEIPDAVQDGPADFVVRAQRAAEVRRQAGEIDAAWQSLNETCDRIEQTTSDPALAALRRLAAGAAAEADTLSALRHEIDRYAVMAAGVDDAVEAWWAQIDAECLRRSPLFGQERLEAVNLAWFDEFSNELRSGRHTQPEGDDPRRIDGQRTRLAALNEEYRQHCGIALADSPANELKELHAEFNDLGDLAWMCGTEEIIRERWSDAVGRTDELAQLLAKAVEECRDCERVWAQLPPGQQRFAQAEALAGAWDDFKREAEGACNERLNALRRAERRLDLLNLTTPVIALREELQGLGASWRESVIRDALEQFGTELELPHDWDADYRNWIADATSYLDALAVTVSQLDGAYSHSSISRLPADVEGLAGLPVVQEVRGRLDAMARLRETADDAARLRSTVTGDGQIELRFEAWRLLRESTPDEHSLAAESDLQRVLAALLAGLSDAERREQLRDELAAGLRDRFIAHARAARDPDAFQLVFDHREAIPPPLPEDVQFKIALHGRYRSIYEARARDLCELLQGEFLEWITVQPERLLPGGDWLDQLRQLIEGCDDEGPGFGPAAADWNEVEVDDELVRGFEWRSPGGTVHALSFRRVEVEDSHAVYLLTHEVPVGVFLDVIQPRWAEVRDLFPGIDRLRAHAVRTWLEDQTGNIARARRWDESPNHEPYAAALRGRVRQPTDFHPAQFVSPAGAAFMAAAIGCRLPSQWEQEAALRLAGKVVQERMANLRCHLWSSQHVHAKGQQLSPRPDPAEEIFLQDRTADVWFDDNGLPAVEGVDVWEDDHLWFRQVRHEDALPTQFRDLIGNVWELIFDAPEEFERRLLRPDIDPAQLKQEVEQLLTEWPVVSVIGGSALSPPHLGLDEPQPFPTERGEWWTSIYADVGFRLAFSASGAGNVREQLLALVQKAYARDVEPASRSGF